MTEPRRATAEPKKILNALKRLLNQRQAWDEKPEWGLIFDDGEGRIRTSALPVPALMWEQAGHPARVVASLTELIARPPSLEAQAVSMLFRKQLPANLVGMYIRSEGWAPPKGKELEVHQRREQGWETPRFEHMMGRREIRMVNAVDTADVVYLAQQPRDTMELEGFFAERIHDIGSNGLPAANPRQDGIAGILVDTLNKAMDAMLSPPVPPYPPTS